MRAILSKDFFGPVTCTCMCVFDATLCIWRQGPCLYLSTLLLEIPKKIMIRSEGSGSISNIMLMYYGNSSTKKNMNKFHEGKGGQIVFVPFSPFYETCS